MLAALLVSMSAVPDPAPKLNDLRWMVGDWQCEVWGGVFEERWSPASGGSMLGAGKLVKEGKTAFEEHMSLRESEGKVVMWIHTGALSDKAVASTPFTLTQASADVARFENPAHDFPKTITYTRKGKDRLDCVIQGVQNGKDSRTLFEFRRARR